MKYFTNTLTLVLAFLAAGALSAQLSVTPSPAADANTTVTFNLYDTFGDGWNGAVSIGVSGERAVVAGADGNCVPEVSIVPFSESITWTGGNFNCGPGLVDLVVAKNSELVIESFAGGTFATEPYFTVEDAGNTILEFVNTGAFFNCPQNNGLTGAGTQCSPTTLPCSASVGDNGEVDCPDGAVLPGGISIYGEDSWGDGWDGAYIEIELFDENGAPAGTINAMDGLTFGGPGSFTGAPATTEFFDVPSGGSANFTWSPSCGFNEIENWEIFYHPPSSTLFDEVTGECVIDTPTPISIASGFGCNANQVLAQGVQFGVAAGLPCPGNTTVVLEDGDCWPVETYCLGDINFQLEPLNACDLISEVSTLDIQFFGDLTPANAIDCETGGSCDDDGEYSMLTINGDDQGNGMSCPDYNFTNLATQLFHIPWAVNPDYESLNVTWSYQPDLNPGAGDERIFYIPVDANGAWDGSAFNTAIVFPPPNGPISGSFSIDMASYGGANTAGLGIYTINVNNTAGSAAFQFTAEYVDAEGTAFTVGLSSEEACDVEATYTLDMATGAVTVNYIPGVNEVCFVLDDGCTTTSCSFTYTVDNSAIKQALACNDHINLSVDQSCEALITADMILEGSPYYCDEEYIIEITTPGGIPVANPLVYDPTYAPNNEYIVSVYDPYTCNSCWGTLTLEDKIDPTLECDCPPGAWVTDPACNIDCDDIPRYLSGSRGGASAVDNCGGGDVQFSGATATEVECGQYVIEQIWTLTVPGYGGSDVPTTLTCVNQFYATSPEFDEDDCPSDVEYDCTDQGEDASIHPDDTGYPELGGVEIGAGDQDPYCNVFAGYEDLEIPACGLDCYGPVKIFRTWTVLDWCSGDSYSCQQIIKVTDNTPPTIYAPDMTVSTEPWVCSADVWLNDPLIHDNCSYDLDWCIASTNSGAILVDEDGNSGSNSGPKKHALNVPKGWWEFTIKATDCCGNTGYHTLYVHVVDLTPPVAIATQNIVISLTSSGDDWDGLAKLYKTSIDNGSHDNCSGVWCEIRRDEDPCELDGNTTYSNKIPEACDPWYDDDDHDYGEYVKFCCADLTEIDEMTGVAYGIVKVWMRVWDDGNMDGVHGSFVFYDNPGNDHDYCDFNDNYNETWVHVRVEDKAPVQLICPPDVTIPCHWDWTDTSLTGVAVASTTCGHPCVDYTDWPSVHCGEGYVLREWRVVDCDSGEDLSEYICVQRITVEPVPTPLEVVCPTYEEFDGDLLWFDPLQPNHVAIDCADFEFPEPWQSGGKCNLIGVSTSVDTFWFEEDACFKAIKKWHYVDWCTNDEYECEFTVSVVDTEPPMVTCQDTCVAVNDYWDDDEDGVYCEMEDDVEVCATGEDMGDCESVWIKWVVYVDYWYDGIVDEEYSSFYPHSDPYYLEPTPNGEKVYIDLDKDELGGEWARHVVEWKAFDGCGNVSQCHQYVEVADKKAPTPYCVGLSTALMSPEAGNLVELWAKDFNLGSFDNCTAEHWLRYTFNEVPPVLSDDDGESLLDEEHCFEPVWDDRDNCVPMRDPETGYIVSEETSCNNYEDGATRPDCPIDGVQKWNPDGVDEFGNPCKTSGMKFIGTDWCGVNPIRVSVWDKKLNMDFCWIDLVVHGTECDSTDTPRIEGTVSTETGATLEGAEVTNTSSLMVQTDMTDATGHYAFDFNLMGEDYAITAEKNNDWLNGVSTLDLVMIQRHILGLSQLNSGYKLVAADINNDANVTAVDLVELRKLILGIYTELPNNQSWRFIDAKQSLSSVNPWPINEEVNISSIADDMMSEDFVATKVGDVNGSAVTNLAGNDTELRSNNKLDFIVETVGNSVVVKAGSNFDNVYGYQFTMNVDGQLSGVYAGALDLNAGNFGVLENGEVTTSFASETAVSLNEGEVLFTLEGVNSVNLVNGFTRAEAYTSEAMEIVNVSLRDGESTSVYSLSQNEPNPFSDVTNISFTLGVAGPATLTVYDVTGKVITTIDGEYERGNHVIQVAKQDLGTTGIMYYQLESGDFTATKKMIIIE